MAQYRAFFEENAPYSVTDYSFSPPEIEGDSATVDAAFTVTSASGVEVILEVDKRGGFLSEGGDRVGRLSVGHEPGPGLDAEVEAAVRDLGRKRGLFG